MSLNQNLLSSLAIFAPLLILSFNFFENILIVTCYSLLNTSVMWLFASVPYVTIYKYEFIGDLLIEPL